ncbi:MAG: SGNH/GDSL hydrolase family protein [Firmicutes bacterium]|nr:SGNH/GDSL hydrolase family protein [Bacillota bacterium]
MKNIYLVGDSIRFGAAHASGSNLFSPGYECYVREKLRGRVGVYAPEENCRFTQYTLRFLNKWAGTVPAGQIDLVHWNNGLWDAVRQFGDEPLNPIDVYVATLRRIYARIRLLFPNAQIVFALTTPVIEEKQNKDSRRRNSDIEAYNKAAAETMRELGVPVNDLYTLAKGFDDSYYSDAVHFNEKGCDALAEQVAKVCMELLEQGR